MLTYRKNGEGYEVMDGDRTIGFVMRYSLNPKDSRWAAVDMQENDETFWTRKSAGQWLLARAPY